MKIVVERENEKMTIAALDLQETGKKFFDWTGAPLLKDEGVWSVPKTLYWGLFDKPDATAEDKAAMEEMIRFLEAFAAVKE